MRRALTLIACLLLVAGSQRRNPALRARLVVGEGLNEPFAVDFDATRPHVHRRDGRQSRQCLGPRDG